MTLPLTPAEVAAGRRNDKIGTGFVAETGGMRIGMGIWHRAKPLLHAGRAAPVSGPS